MVGFHKAIAQLMDEGRDRATGAADAPALAQFLVRLKESVLAPEQALIEAFARELLAKVSLPAETADVLPLVRSVVGAFRFFRDRGREPVAIRIFSVPPSRAGAAPYTVIETVLGDRPFIVDTICETVVRAGGDVRDVLHPVLGVQRTAQGVLEQVGPPDRFAARESFVHLEATRLERAANLERVLGERLHRVVQATDDYQAMRRRVAELAAELRARSLPPPWDAQAQEVVALLEWLGEKNFVYLGYCECELRAVGAGHRMMRRRGTGLGILRENGRGPYDLSEGVPDDWGSRVAPAPLLTISKTRALSPVHRLAPMDDVRVLRVGPTGSVIGEHRLLGLFTSKAYHEPASETPLLRREIAAVLEREGAVEDSHDYRNLVSLFDSFPKEELFAGGVEDIHQVMRAIMAVQARGGVRVLCRPDAFRRGLFATVIVPRARFSTALHERVSARLCERLAAAVLHEHVALDERPQVRLHYYLAVAAAVLEHPPTEALEHDLNELLRTWDDELRDALARVYPPAAVDRLAGKYGTAFPAAYKAGTEVAQAVRDIRLLETLVTSGHAQIDIAAPPPGTAPALWALRLYVAGPPLVLSDFIPIMENLGLRVFGEDVVDVALAEIAGARIHTFFVQAAAAADLDIAAAQPLLAPALQVLRSGEVENDRLNMLILHAGLDWRAVEVLRTYVEHARQLGVASRTTLVEALTRHPESARRLFRFFAAKFDPDASPLTAAQRLAGPAAEAEASFVASLEAVDSLVHDRVLRALGAAVAATVRTNFYRRAGEEPEATAVAIKLAAAELPHVPRPRPMFEVYVHAPHMEGVHLRAGRVARGGIRFSDRPDDFRAEILGLMKTQAVKNAVIVPVGAKGGFVVKPRGGAAPVSPQDVERAYRTLIGALLSITDNIEHGRPVPPHGQLVYDEPDPYLVVAADKGTAGFSDIANEIAARYQFWLGDAFASGGRHGYDHKQLGITARGAWECARQHFREMGRDIDRDPITVIGIGDMSGDVFGNGLLRSRTLRLRAAFNHRHIFLDPNPDAERSYWERERLFRLPQSGWNDYDPACLSPGGGVFPRSAKAVALTPPVRAMLGVDAESLSGEELVQAILRMPADLLWNGGIGTYVKASDETHAEVGDPANDRVRVDARDLRVLVVVEGGNLGITQRGRIEFALAGGRINTDAIDNSGGVDCSDHEVNLKIALQPLVSKHQLSLEERNALLAELAAVVCEAVLAHNRRQALALSLDQVRSRTGLHAFRDLMAMLEAEAGLDRLLERLPTREALRARRGVYLGLTRPELAVLLAFTKLDLQQRILASTLCDERDAVRYVFAYFPEAAVQRIGHVLHLHPLRREITAVEIANRLVDSMGMTFVLRLVRDTGREASEIVKAWTAAMAISGGDDVLDHITAQRPGLSAAAEEQCAFAVQRAIERATKWVLETQSLSAPLDELIASLRAPVEELRLAWPELLADERRAAYAAEVHRLTDAGVAPALAEEVARLAGIEDALEIAHIAAQLDTAPALVAHAYFQAAALADLDWVRDALPTTVPGEDRWEQRAVGGLLEGLLHARRQLTMDVLACGADGEPIGDRVRRYAEAAAPQLARLRGVIDDLKAAQPTLAGMLVAMRELGRLTRPRAE